jgi:beta-lactamase superfamily II metal-dependent hydrolase
MKQVSRVAISLLAGVVLAGCGGGTQLQKGSGGPATLDIYFIDVEGGQSTLVVTPRGESLLIDAGFPGDGTFSSKPGDPAHARDPQRIMSAARAAGISRIDYLLLTHFHADHDGGVAELAQLIPIGTFIDHAAPLPEAEAGVPGTQAIYDAYVGLRARGAHLEPRPGDRLPLNGVDAVVVASAASVLQQPLDGAGATNNACAGNGVAPQEKTENPRSTGVLLTFGKFRFLDIGDLSGPPLFALTCPVNRVGEVSVYLVAHHGGADASDPALFAATKPRVAIFNNGPRKGAQAETFATLRAHPTVDLWQLHRSLNVGVENMPDERIANLDESTSAWLKLSAHPDGSFSITNGRTGRSRTYPR